MDKYQVRIFKAERPASLEDVLNHFLSDLSTNELTVHDIKYNIDINSGDHIAMVIIKNATKI